MERGTTARLAWEQRRDDLFAADPGLAQLWDQYFAPGRVDIGPLGFEPGSSVATRKASGAAINKIASDYPSLVGGSADLEPSTNTLIDDVDDLQAGSPGGRNLRFGVREHAMGTLVNGISIHGGMRAFGATFLVFNDYMRPATRLAALMKAPSIWIYTHDSVFLGEDGPTHQPIEQIASLRAMPNMWVLRPADAGETAEAWELALNRTDGPTSLILTRQGVPVLERDGLQGGVHRGGYVLRKGEDAVLVATGSEVWVALEAAELLSAGGLSIRVVSLPCWEAFFAQDEDYRRSVLGEGLPRASIEAGSTLGWGGITGSDGLNIGIDHFGASAPRQRLAEEWGFTPQAVAERIRAWLPGR
jgi:transketolase